MWSHSLITCRYRQEFSPADALTVFNAFTGIYNMTDKKQMHLDQSITRIEDDRYGFRYIASQLAQSIRSIGREGNAVIGIEGIWGSGKTSLLNLLRTALNTPNKDNKNEDNIFVLNISPWLDGSETSLVESLLLPVAGIIATEEERRLSPEDRESQKKKETLTQTARNLMEYIRVTARHLAPVAQLASVVPCVPDASSALNAVSESRWLKEKVKTTAQLRTEIAEKIAELDLSFIILLDDLDRLEPAQAVEVIRLVKSVADFPRFRYVLCYDKAVLAQAISRGLGVDDGNLYLQKIVQIAFSLPRPETFVLRNEFLEGAISLYSDVNSTEPDQELQSDLSQVADIYGGTLKTPREVQLALNALRFRYAGMRDYVYFPDLCFLQLIRTTNSGLYDWVEEYLTERAIVESGDGSISEEEKKELIKRLTEHLSYYFPLQAHSAYTLQDWVPGLSGGIASLPISLFNKSDDDEKVQMTMQKRLGSQAYWRYYFAFSSPQNVLPPEYFDDIFRLAAEPGKQAVLAEKLLSQIHGKNISSRTWFEHILSQLTKPEISRRSSLECEGLLQFFFDYGDEIFARYLALNSWFSLYELDTYGVADRLIKRICEDNKHQAEEKLRKLIMQGNAWLWIAVYLRQLLRQHGLAGNPKHYEQEQWLPQETLQSLSMNLASRLNSPEITHHLLNMPSLNSYIWAWRDISGVEVIKEWIDALSQKEENFLKLLLLLRHYGTSSETGRYRALSLAQLSEFLGEEQKVEDRISHIENNGQFQELVDEVNTAIRNSSF